MIPISITVSAKFLIKDFLSIPPYNGQEYALWLFIRSKVGSLPLIVDEKDINILLILLQETRKDVIEDLEEAQV